MNIHKPINFLLWENNKFQFEDSVKHTKIEQSARPIINNIIENDKLYQHPELYTWIDKEYFKNISNKI